ncbi:hypothetical protein FF1_039845 [Malus domestica]
MDLPDSSPFEAINQRLLLVAERKTGWQPPVQQIMSLIALKEGVLTRMAELDPHPFWMEEQSRNRLLREGASPSPPDRINEVLKRIGERSGLVRSLREETGAPA